MSNRHPQFTLARDLTSKGKSSLTVFQTISKSISIVAVDEPVTHSDDVGPTYFRIMFTGLLRDMDRGLADNLDRFARGKIESVTGSVKHVSQPYFVGAAHTR